MMSELELGISHEKGDGSVGPPPMMKSNDREATMPSRSTRGLALAALGNEGEQSEASDAE